MANVGELSLTLNDIRKRQNLDGSIAKIVELMEKSDPIMQEIKWQEGNELTGNKTTQRTSLPQAYVRMLNKGVPAGKSTTKQITDTCVTFEGHIDTDRKLLMLQNDPEAYRASEVKAMAAGMTQQIASMIFYGKKETGSEFDGLASRYANYGGELNDAAYQVINAGGTLSWVKISRLIHMRRRYFEACLPYICDYANEELAQKIKNLSHSQ